MSFKALAQKGINGIRKTNQQHQMPVGSLKLFGRNWKKKNCIYGLCWSNDRIESIDFIKKLSYTIDSSSCINVLTEDPFVEHNLKQELKYLKNVKVNEFDMNYDLPAGNPEFYRRSPNASGSRVGNALIFDKHIQNAVARKSGKFKENGPFVTDWSWFQGEQGQGSFRRWLFGSNFGLKNLVILDSAEFDVSDTKGLVMIYGEDGYDGPITVKNMITGSEFTKDFRKIGYIIVDENLAELLPKIATNKKYDWKRTNNQLDKIPEVKNGKVLVLGTMHLNQEPTFYYTSKKYISDWKDSDNERFVTRYQPATSHDRYYEIAVGAVIPPGVIIPGGMNFTYVNVEEGTGPTHKNHLMSKEVTKILKATRTGKSLHTPQTIWVPYVTEFKGFTKDDKKIINNL
jgi:hypothetical protein